MREYYLADPTSRGTVDLRDYEAEIVAAVHAMMPNATVIVKEKSYCVSPAPERGAAIKIGRALSKKNVLGSYCVQIPKLFNSTAVEAKEDANDTRKEPRHGGHR